MRNTTYKELWRSRYPHPRPGKMISARKPSGGMVVTYGGQKVANPRVPRPLAGGHLESRQGHPSDQKSSRSVVWKCGFLRFGRRRSNFRRFRLDQPLTTRKEPHFKGFPYSGGGRNARVNRGEDDIGQKPPGRFSDPVCRDRWSIDRSRFE